MKGFKNQPMLMIFISEKEKYLYNPLKLYQLEEVKSDLEEYLSSVINTDILFCGNRSSFGIEPEFIENMPSIFQKIKDTLRFHLDRAEKAMQEEKTKAKIREEKQAAF